MRVHADDEQPRLVTSRNHPSSDDRWDDSELAELPTMFRRFKLAQTGSPESRRQRDAIIERCLPLAARLAGRYLHRGESRDDLLQVARLGLVAAVDRYDIDVGAPFVAFAVPTILGELRRHFRDRGWAIRVPRGMQELSMRLTEAESLLEQQLRRLPSPSELASHLDVPREDVIQGMIARTAYRTLSTDVARHDGDGDGVTILHTRGVVDPRLDHVVDVESVRPLIEALPQRERMILELRFFDGHSQSEIARRIGVSQMHVSRLLEKTLTDLRAALSDHRI